MESTAKGRHAPVRFRAAASHSHARQRLHTTCKQADIIAAGSGMAEKPLLTKHGHRLALPTQLGGANAYFVAAASLLGGSRSLQKGPGGGSVSVVCPFISCQLPPLEWPMGSHVLRCWLPMRSGTLPARTSRFGSNACIANLKVKLHVASHQRAEIACPRPCAC